MQYLAKVEESKQNFKGQTELNLLFSRFGMV